jgi:hypothetical protein
MGMATRSDPANARRERSAVVGRRTEGRSDLPLAGGDGFAPPDESDEATRPEDAVSIDEVVERLSRDLSAAVNRAPTDERDELRTYAAELLREDTAPAGSHGRSPTRRARLSFFAVAVWLAVAGVVLAFLLPPAAFVCFLLAGVAALLAAILGPGEVRPERSAEPDSANPTASSPPARDR